MAEKRKSRDGHARKTGKDEPATLETEPAAEPETPKAKGKKKAPKKEKFRPSAEWNPRPVVESLGLWWLNGKDSYFQAPEGCERALSLNSRDVSRMLRIQGVYKAACEGRSYSHIDLVMEHLQRERHVDYAGPLAGKRTGIYEVQNRRILVTTSFRLIEPKAGDWPLLRKVLAGLLGDQTTHFFAWLKVGFEALQKGVRRPGHGLILAGPSDCGKSFVQEHVITPIFGGRSADPTKHLLGKTTFNAELVGAEHLAMQELPAEIGFQSRLSLGDELKRLISTESQSLHPKFCDAITVYPWWRVSLSINNNVDRLRAFPALTSDFGDKVIVLLCESHPENFAGPSDEERRAFLDTITAELPAFLAFLLSWEIPAALKTTKHASRFGCDHFHHPEIAAAMFDGEVDSSLLYILDNTPSLYQDGAWGWGKSEALREALCEANESARRLFSSKQANFQNSCGSFLAKLAEKFPDRFISKHTAKGNVWLVKDGRD